MAYHPPHRKPVPPLVPMTLAVLAGTGMAAGFALLLLVSGALA